MMRSKRRRRVERVLALVGVYAAGPRRKRARRLAPGRDGRWRWE